MSSERKRCGWKIMGGLFGVLVVFVVASWGWVRAAESRKWAAMEQRVAELSAKILPANQGRRPLVGEPLQGNAWDDYGQALSAFAGMKPGEVRQTTQVLDDNWRGEAEPLVKVRAVEILRDFRIATDAVRRGARRATARSPLPEFSGEQISALASLIRNQADAVIQESPDDAVDILFDLFQFGVDLDAAGSISGADVCEKGVHTLHRLLHRLPTARRVEMEQALFRLEQSISLTRVLEKELRFFGEYILKAPETLSNLVEFMDDKKGLIRSSWRYGFSKPHLAADGFEWMDDWIRHVTSWDHLPYAQAQAAMAEQEKAIHTCPNRGAHYLIERYLNEPQRYRELIARIRLLRSAFGSEGLQDPFGGLLKSGRVGESLRIWSVGPDGVDDGGNGSWSGEGNRDIVLEVKR